VFEQVRPYSNIQLLSFSLVRSRTWSCSKPTGIQLDTTTERASVAFEVDAIDQATRTGWSMVVRDPWPNHPPHPPGAGIINISSVIGEKGNIGQANYAAAKSGLFGLTNSLALKTARNGITVNSVAPGEMVAALPEEALQRVIGQIPVGRRGEPDEVAWVVEVMADPEWGYITGEGYGINGGLCMCRGGAEER
jgi:NAD(P)-dependent dehydrogenase (short-subunit alcohol dehydrogenase family)